MFIWSDWLQGKRMQPLVLCSNNKTTWLHTVCPWQSNASQKAPNHIGYNIRCLCCLDLCFRLIISSNCVEWLAQTTTTHATSCNCTQHFVTNPCKATEVQLWAVSLRQALRLRPSITCLLYMSDLLHPFTVPFAFTLLLSCPPRVFAGKSFAWRLATAKKKENRITLG